MSIARTVTAVALGLSALSMLACVGTVQGERAASGSCPRDAECAPETPDGLMFTGQVLYDQPGERLGPVLLGGKMQVGIAPVSGTLPAYDVLIGDPAVLDAAPTEGGMQLVGLEPGSSMVSVVDARGRLFDRLPMDVVEVDDVELSIVPDPDRQALLGGCTDMVGVRLIATGQDGQRLRAFDQDVQIAVSVGDVSPDVGVWDCFRLDVPADATVVHVTVTAGGEQFEATLDVVPVGDPEGCPTLTD